MKISAFRNRLKINTAQQTGITEVLNGATPFTWNGSAVQFELGLFYRDALVDDLSNIDQLTLEIKPLDDLTGAALVSKTISSGALNGTLSEADWADNDEDNCHAKVELTGDEATFDLADQDANTFWLVISILRDDGEAITLGATQITVQEDGRGVEAPESVVTPTYLTLAQSDARYVLSLDLTTIENDITALQASVATKQATITGAATTIATSNLTLSRALVSDGSGKVAVSSVTSAELAYLSGVTSAIQTQFSGKQATITGGATTIASSNLTVSRALASDGSGKVAVSSVTATELGYLSGVTSAIQTQFSGKQATITGAATTVASSDLTVNLALISNGSGKIAVSAVTSTELSYLSGVTSAIQTQISSKQATITGGATTIATTDLTVSRALVSDASGKVAVATVTATELGYLSGVTSALQTQISARLQLAGGTLAGALQFSGTSHAGIQVLSLTSSQIAALGSVANGYVLYDSTLSRFRFREGASWKDFSSIGGGTTWFSQSGAPSGGTGTDGNYDIDTADGTIYLKASGSWSALVAARLPLSGGTLTGALEFDNAMSRCINFPNNYFAHYGTLDYFTGFGIGYNGFYILEMNSGRHVNIANGNLYIRGTQVLTDQQAANPNTSGATLGQLETEVNELKAMLRNHGLIAT
jgi:fructose-specific component phosphotransferase system IIB-like protein